VRRLKREERVSMRVEAARVLVEIATCHGLGIDVLRGAHPGRPPQIVTAVRKKFILRMRGKVSMSTIADLLFCDISTVQYHSSEKYRKKKESNIARYTARSGAAAGEDPRLDRPLPPW